MVCPSQNVLKSSSSSFAVYGRSSGGSSGGSGPQTMIETKDLYFSHPRECSIYIGCDEYGNMSVLECLNGTHFSPYYQSCVHASIAQCRKYATIDQTPINISLRLLIMNNSLKNFDLELFNNSNETILEESFLNGVSIAGELVRDQSSTTTTTTTTSLMTQSEATIEATDSSVIETRALNYLNNTTEDNNSINLKNVTGFGSDSGSQI